MRTETKTFTYYSFEELTEEGKLNALNNERYINIDDDDWYLVEFDDCKIIGSIMGIDIDRIFFSGFSSQGDGACFEGFYRYKKGSIKELKNYCPMETELHRIVKELQVLQKKHCYRLTASVKHVGRYSHEHCTSIDINNDVDCFDCPELESLLRDFMRYIYRALENQYFYLSSDERIRETILINEYEFTSEGKLL